MKHLAYYPAVGTREELEDLLSRAAWFLTFSPIEKIYVPISDPALSRVEWRIAPGMDPTIRDRFDALRQLVDFVPVGGQEDVVAEIDRADAILRWRLSDESEPQDTAFETWTVGKRVFEVDPKGVRQEGGNYIDVSSRLYAGEETRELHRERLAGIGRQLGTFERGFVLATGPSVARFDQFDYKGSLSVVCNTAILNEELMETVKPQFVVFADPIFHFGPSRYAAKFRDELRRAAERHPFTICTAAKYYPVFEAASPELADRTIAIPFRKDRDFNFDLTSDFELRTTANVLTLLMLPLAATFARNIGLLGCDGRPLSEDKYFWNHNPSTQMSDEMANTLEVHPGFFDIEYNDYYLEHCETLEQQLDYGERAGRQFASLTRSHIPALQARESEGTGFRGPVAEQLITQTDTAGSSAPPRLLVIDPTRVNSYSATGRLKGTWLAGWPEAEFMQVYGAGNGQIAIARSLEPGTGDAKVSADEALDEIARFLPDVIYYRPIIDTHRELHSLALEVLNRHSVGLATHIMDDWPARLARVDAKRAREVDTELRSLFSRSQAALSISEKMSTVFEKRYGVPFEPLANGVDPEIFRSAAAAAAPGKDKRDEVIIRYAGSLATDMTFESVLDVARSIAALQGQLPIHFQVYTGPRWVAPFEKAVAGLRGVDVLDLVESDRYPDLLAGAHVLLLAYNFDQESIDYIGLSMPNKLPEYLASNSALLAFGPREANGINYVFTNDLACCITERDPRALNAAIRKLATDGEYRSSLASRGQLWAFERMNIYDARRHFERVIRRAATGSSEVSSGHPDGARGATLEGSVIVGPYVRGAKATVDETKVIARLLIKDRASEHTMLDAGAHAGSSLKPFAKAGWRVLAFEPDRANRESLVQAVGSMLNVEIDTRALSDAPAPSASFFTSNESTGISGLSAFRPTHVHAYNVEVTTVAHVVTTRKVTDLEFLKIDVEGFEMNVLKGVPWDRVRPKAIMCEFEDAKSIPMSHAYTDIADYLVGKGYTVYLSEWHPIVRYGINHDWRQLIKYPAPLASKSAWGNLLAFIEDPGEGALREHFLSCLKVGTPSAASTIPQTVSGALKNQKSTSATLPSKVQPPRQARPKPLSSNVRSTSPTTGGLSTHQGGSNNRTYVWTRQRLLSGGSHPVALLTRLGVWTLRRIREHKVATLAYVAFVAGLVGIGFISEIEPYGRLAWLLAGGLVLFGTAVLIIGFANFLVAETRTQSKVRHQATTERIVRAERRLIVLEERQDLIENSGGYSTPESRE